MKSSEHCKKGPRIYGSGQCIICGAEFVKHAPNTRVCSEQCHRIRIKQLNAKRNRGLALGLDRPGRQGPPRRHRMIPIETDTERTVFDSDFPEAAYANPYVGTRPF